MVRIWLIYVFILFADFNLFAQQNIVRFRHYNIDNGLSHNVVLSICQDSDGYLWIGTRDGLNKYDGYNMTTYLHEPSDTGSIRDNVVSCIYEDNRRNLWIAINGYGLELYDRDNDCFIHYPEDKIDLRSVEILNMFEDARGNFWIGTQNGLKLFDREKNHTSHVPYNEYKLTDSTLSSSAVFDIFEDSEFRLWLATYNGLNLYDHRTGIVKHFFIDHNFEDISGNNWIKSIHESWDGNLWLASNDGFKIFQYETKQFYDGFEYLKLNVKTAHQRLNNIVMDDNGNIWFAGWEGVLFLNSESRDIKVFLPDQNNPEALTHRAVTVTYKDQSGGIWLGTWNGGLNYFHRSFNKFKLYRQNNSGNTSLSGKIVRAITTDVKGNIWLGIDQGGLNFFNRENKKIKHISQQGSSPYRIAHNNVRCLEWRDHKSLWIGTQGGLSLIDTKSFRVDNFKSLHITNPDLLPTDIWSLCYDFYGQLWIGTRNGLYLYNQDKDSLKKFKHDPDNKNSVSDNFVYAIYQDKQKNIWIGTDYGLNLFKSNKGEFVRYYNNNEEFNQMGVNRIICIFEDSKSRLWLGTHGGGLNLFNREENSFRNYRIKDGLPNEVIYGILEDNTGKLWLSTNLGLSAFDVEQGSFHNYDIRDGLQSNQFYYNAYHKDKNGEMFFGGVNGFNSFFPENLYTNHHIPNVEITGLKIFNQDVSVVVDSLNEGVLKKHISQTDHLTLDYYQSVITFEFVATGFGMPDKNQYAYKLVGFDKNWNYVGTKRTATYTSLEPGTYHFRVIGANCDGIWNREGASLELVILPPWWETWWFRLIIILTIIGILYLLGQMIRNREQLKNNLRLERIEAEKAREIDAMKIRFFSNISHELRTPLTLILGPVEKLVNFEADEAFRNEYRIIQKNAYRLLRLINQLLDLSKIEAGYMKLEVARGNIVDYIESIVAAFEYRAIKNKTNLKFNKKTVNLTGYFDGDKIEKIIYNLLSNAFKYTSAGGSVMVSVEEKVYHRDNQPKSHVEVIVEDTGQGIPESDLHKVFERFYHVSASRKRHIPGTGLGLTLVKQLTEIHHGTIKVNSKINQGTMFILSIPIAEDEYQPDHIVDQLPDINEKIEKITKAEVQKGETKMNSEIYKGPPNQKIPILLIIDDDNDIREYIRSNIQGEYKIYEADNGESGLEKAFELIPDLVISDIMMPQMDGFELCKKLKGDEKTSHIPIIILTAKPESENKLLGLETGAEDYIIKPFNIQELKLKVKNIISSREKIKQALSKKGHLLPSGNDINPLDEKFLQKAMKIIERNMDNPDFGIEKFCENMGTSRMQLYRKMDALTGQTVKEYIRNIRLNRASQLLLKKQFTVNEIAYMCGFREISYFRKCFREKFNMSPTEYVDNEFK